MESLFDLIWGEEDLELNMLNDEKPMAEACMVCLCKLGKPSSGNNFPGPTAFLGMCKDE